MISKTGVMGLVLVPEPLLPSVKPIPALSRAAPAPQRRAGAVAMAAQRAQQRVRRGAIAAFRHTNAFYPENGQKISAAKYFA